MQLKQEYPKIIKFLMSGGMAALVEYSTFLILHSLSLKLVVANALSFSGGLVTSFLLNKHWVFGHKGGVSKQFGMYFMLAMLNLVLGSWLLVFLVHTAEIPAPVSKVGVMGLIAVWNYILYRKVIFKDASPPSA